MQIRTNDLLYLQNLLVPNESCIQKNIIKTTNFWIEYGYVSFLVYLHLQVLFLE